MNSMENLKSATDFAAAGRHLGIPDEALFALVSEWCSLDDAHYDAFKVWFMKHDHLDTQRH